MDAPETLQIHCDAKWEYESFSQVTNRFYRRTLMEIIRVTMVSETE